MVRVIIVDDNFKDPRKYVSREFQDLLQRRQNRLTDALKQQGHEVEIAYDLHNLSSLEDIGGYQAMITHFPCEKDTRPYSKRISDPAASRSYKTSLAILYKLREKYPSLGILVYEGIPPSFEKELKRVNAALIQKDELGKDICSIKSALESIINRDKNLLQPQTL